MKIKILLMFVCLSMLGNSLFGQKNKQAFKPKNKASMGYSVLFPPIDVGSHGPQISERTPFHGVNLGYERKVFNHFSVNLMTHFVFGAQNGWYNPSIGNGFYLKTSRFRQIDVDFRLYTSKQLKGFFVGGGPAFIRGNLFKTESGVALSRGRTEFNGNALIGYSQVINNKWFVQIQGATGFWGNAVEPSLTNRIKWYRHTLSFQTGLLF